MKMLMKVRKYVNKKIEEKKYKKLKKELRVALLKDKEAKSWSMK